MSALVGVASVAVLVMLAGGAWLASTVPIVVDALDPAHGDDE